MGCLLSQSDMSVRGLIRILISNKLERAWNRDLEIASNYFRSRHKSFTPIDQVIHRLSVCYIKQHGRSIELHRQPKASSHYFPRSSQTEYLPLPRGRFSCCVYSTWHHVLLFSRSVCQASWHFHFLRDCVLWNPCRPTVDFKLI